MNEVVFGEGAVDRLAMILSEFPGPVLMVSGDQSYAESGAKVRIEPNLQGRAWDRVIVRSRLPGLEVVHAAVSRDRVPGVILAVGGGSVIDVAKLIALGFNNGVGPDLLHSGGKIDAIPIVAIPTTAGSGSERTPFAVAYRGSTKYSVTHPSILPRYALVDPTLTYSLPAGPTAASGLDVIAHSMESAWAASATMESITMSLEALALAWPALIEVVTSPSPSSRTDMASASTLAGAAIATAKTTASHALSYYLSATHAVPHGVAVAVTLGPVLQFNAAVDASNVSGPRDPSAIRETIWAVCHTIGADDPQSAGAIIEDRMKALGVPTRLSETGVTMSELAEMAQSVNKERLSNNPRLATQDDLLGILRQVA